MACEKIDHNLRGTGEIETNFEILFDGQGRMC